ncbi:uncharacterized protein L969DRAFT_72423 [Mixia osmundae IAM 14324]|uniref:uncharacterized protein n=1 Tax=Mixia osmundae (strain CBS 9802 / IAM 14324 / JCM 22182 / KY 12970) TaxID=764103 RepID=UPI0004A54FF4|nr:uncharacterized protein L969DRAFT_72423 [Mixia osmundae IAM 14324]KEI40889.1 hypothetical protein L969DRAFT_72423 [Mixia osmundae IAM 14324]
MQSIPQVIVRAPSSGPGGTMLQSDGTLSAMDRSDSSMSAHSLSQVEEGLSEEKLYGQELETPTEVSPTYRRDSKHRAAASAALPLEQHSKARPNPLPAWLLIIIWISLSSGVIVYNRYILRDLDFPYPIFLTAMHTLFQTIATRIIVPHSDVAEDHLPVPLSEAEAEDQSAESSLASLKRVTVSLINTTYYRTVVPIGVLTALSLYLSNAVYMLLSVGMIQILKSFGPVAVLTMSILLGLRRADLLTMGIIALISTGVGIASYGEAQWNTLGFVMQISAVWIESTKLALIQILLQGKGLTPLESLHAFSPICLLALGAMILPVEGTAPFHSLSNLGPFIILTNSALTFCLNLTSNYLINLSSLTLSLSKVIKDIGLVILSGVFLSGHVSAVQWAGYSIALVGLGW